MSKQSVEEKLNQPYRTGEKVITTNQVGPVPPGTRGKVRLANGLGNWKRYWVKFESGMIIGHIDHSDLVKPELVTEWHQQKRLEEEAENEETVAEDVGAQETAATGNSSDSAIPAHLLERSQAAKKRLLG